jgi:hypothetical protein
MPPQRAGGCFGWKTTALSVNDRTAVKPKRRDCRPGGIRRGAGGARRRVLHPRSCKRSRVRRSPYGVDLLRSSRSAISRRAQGRTECGLAQYDWMMFSAPEAYHAVSVLSQETHLVRRLGITLRAQGHELFGHRCDTRGRSKILQHSQDRQQCASRTRRAVSRCGRWPYSSQTVSS